MRRYENCPYAKLFPASWHIGCVVPWSHYRIAPRWTWFWWFILETSSQHRAWHSHSCSAPVSWVPSHWRVALAAWSIALNYRAHHTLRSS